MDKVQEKLVLNWLKSQLKGNKILIYLSVFLGLLDSLAYIFYIFILSTILSLYIKDNILLVNSTKYLFFILLAFVLRSTVIYIRNLLNFKIGNISCSQIRRKILNHIENMSPFEVQKVSSGGWNSVIIEQIERLHDFYSIYLPQIYLSISVPILIWIVIFFIDWIPALILLFTTPIILLFIIIISYNSSNANKRNFLILRRLSNYFLDRLRGLETIQLFNYQKEEMSNICRITKKFRHCTMEILRLSFLSSSVIEFFSSISVAIIAVYFGFLLLGKISFMKSNINTSLMYGILVTILTPEYFRPIRELGSLYHSKSEAIGAGEFIFSLLKNSNKEKFPFYKGRKRYISLNDIDINDISLTGDNVCILTFDGKRLAGPLNFYIKKNKKLAIIGKNGSGKSSFLNMLLRFLPYSGSLKVNDIELNSIPPNLWRGLMGWVGQNPTFPERSIRDNIFLGTKKKEHKKIIKEIKNLNMEEFFRKLPNGLDSYIGEYASHLSVGQAQKIAIARALIRSPKLLLLDEPTSNIDIYNEKLIVSYLEKNLNNKTVILITHHLRMIKNFDTIWIMDNGNIVQQGHYCDLLKNEGSLLNLIRNKEY